MSRRVEIRTAGTAPVAGSGNGCAEGPKKLARAFSTEENHEDGTN
jgi:hypothetical protein